MTAAALRSSPSGGIKLHHLAGCQHLPPQKNKGFAQKNFNLIEIKIELFGQMTSNFATAEHRSVGTH